MTPRKGPVAIRCRLFFVAIFALSPTPAPPQFLPFQGDFFDMRHSVFPFNPPKNPPGEGAFYEKKYPVFSPPQAPKSPQI